MGNCANTTAHSAPVERMRGDDQQKLDSYQPSAWIR